MVLSFSSNDARLPRILTWIAVRIVFVFGKNCDALTEITFFVVVLPIGTSIHFPEPILYCMFWPSL